jgi:hypothetical protein
MNRWDVGTWIAIVILIVGSLIVFGFFVRDVRVILREMGGPGGRGPAGGGAGGSGDRGEEADHRP